MFFNLYFSYNLKYPYEMDQNILNIKFILVIALISTSPIFVAKDDVSSIEIGQTWYLESRSNKLSPASSKVLYFFPNDAYNTYRARIFSDWDSFSLIDSRNLVRLNTGDRLRVLNSKYFDKIYEVELLDGFEKNKKYFVIRDDLLNDYKLLEKISE